MSDENIDKRQLMPTLVSELEKHYPSRVAEYLAGDDDWMTAAVLNKTTDKKVHEVIAAEIVSYMHIVEPELTGDASDWLTWYYEEGSAAAKKLNKLDHKVIETACIKHGRYWYWADGEAICFKCEEEDEDEEECPVCAEIENNSHGPFLVQ